MVDDLLKDDALYFVEAERELPIADRCEVIVCGGGPAGFSAAISAARAGARVRLFDVNGCLGGAWTAGLLSYVFDFDYPGLTRELTAELDKLNARSGDNRRRYVYDIEMMKYLLENMTLAAGVIVQLHTRVTAVYKENNRLTTIVTESKSGRQAWQAEQFIDATGDGDLGALAGCSWEFGRNNGQRCQPMTLNALVTVPEVEKIKDFILLYGGDDDWKSWQNQARKRLYKEIQRGGFTPSYSEPTLFYLRGSLLTLMANHEYGIKPFDAAQVSAATLRARAEIVNIVNALQSLGGIWQGLRLVATAEQIGVRDGRRIKGRYRVSVDDLLHGVCHEDSVVRVRFGVDVHAASRKENSNRAISNENVKMQPYDIPLRALLAAEVDGLLLAGRCISGDFLAHASYRVTGNAVSMGEAAGVAAALAATKGCLVHELDWSEIVAVLKRD